MSELVQIAPGVVFSSDVLGANWVRRYQPDHAHSQSTDWRSLTVRESDQPVCTSKLAQLSLL